MSMIGDEPGVDAAEMRSGFQREADARLERLEREAEAAARLWHVNWMAMTSEAEGLRVRMWAAFREALQEERGQKG